MKKLVIKVGLGLGILGMTGCAVNLPTAAYTAQNSTRFHGKTALVDFTYAATKDGKIKDNQIRNTAAGAIYTTSKVTDLVKNATALELEKTGVALDDSAGVKLSGSVDELIMDDLGYSIDWKYTIRYIIRSAVTGNELLNKQYKIDPIRTGKFGMPSDYANSLNQVILAGYTLFIRDPQVKPLLQTK